jgi:hypothetical protein
MRVFWIGTLTGLSLQAASAQTILNKEPHYLATGAVVFVSDSRCAAGRVMKVRGIAKGISRRKTCVALGPKPDLFIPRAALVAQGPYPAEVGKALVATR